MTQTNKTYDSVVVKKLDKSRVEITGSIPAKIWEKYRGQALKNINNSIAIDGFRKGNIPENILISKVGDMAILEEMAELALSKVYLDILTNEKIDAIDKPDVQVTKLAKDNPLEFIATTVVMPEITLPEYKNISQEHIAKSASDVIEVSEQDIDEAILQIRKRHANDMLHAKDHTDPTSAKVAENHAQNHDNMSKEEHEKSVEAHMPELTDDFIKTLGNFSDMADFRKKLSGIIADKKKDDAREKTRIRIADALVSHSTIELPDIMIESELDRTQSQFSVDIERMGVKLDDYLKHAKKSLEEIRKEWRPHAEKKAKIQLILNEIARLEKIEVTKDEIKEEVGYIVKHYKDADREKAAVYAETVLTNEKVFQFLENSNK